MQVANIQREILKCMSELQVLQRRRIPSHSSHVQSWLGSDATNQLVHDVSEGDGYVFGNVRICDKDIKVVIDRRSNIETESFKKIFEMKAFIDWCRHFDSAFLKSVKFSKIFIQNVDLFSSRVGFLKFSTDMQYNDGGFIPSITFMRGGAVAILMLLHSIETRRVYGLITVQPRVPVGKAALAEIPAGMIDNASNFSGVAAKEIKEETDIAVNADELVDMTSAAGLDYEGHPGIYPSPGGCDEYIKFYLYREWMLEREILEMQGKMTGNADEGEKIRVGVVPFKRLDASCPDMKTLTALYLYDHIPDAVRLPRNVSCNLCDIDDLKKSKTLIVSTGDISDVDGFMALAKYAQSGCDVMFIMNFPAYLGIDASENKTTEVGLGFKYGSDVVLNETVRFASLSSYSSYLEILRKYGISATDNVFCSSNAKVKQILTDIAFEMATKVWDGASATGGLYFCVGGINDVNPFSGTAVKNEMLVYSERMAQMTQLCMSRQRRVFYKDGRMFSCGPRDILGAYDNIYFDFNGSMAFLDDYWRDVMRDMSEKIKGVVVMGCVYTNATPTTVPPIKDTLNRLSCATMNQLYSPRKTALFFDLMGELGISVYVVANNAVDAFTGEWANFLKSNQISSEILLSYCASYYETNPYKPPRKPYDFYTALVMLALLNESEFRSEKAKLFYDNRFGISLLGGVGDTWEKAVGEYVNKCNDDTLGEQKLRSFLAEQPQITGATYSFLNVNIVEPMKDARTMRVTLPHRRAV